MDPSEFRRHGHALVDWVAEYLSGSEQYPVLPRVSIEYLSRTASGQPLQRVALGVADGDFSYTFD